MAHLLAEPTGRSTDQGSARLRVQHDGDVVFITRSSAGGADIQPADWRTRLAAHLHSIPGAAVVGAKRVDASGMVAAFGEFLIHPKSFHHAGKGAGVQAHRFPEEVDVIARGVAAIRRNVYQAATSTGEVGGELGMVELCLRARLAGYRCVVVPDVVIHDGAEVSPNQDESRAFAARWGFAWNAADLDVVRTRYAGTGLLWNVRLHGTDLGFAKYQDRPALHWKSYEDVSVYRQRADHLVKLVAHVARGGTLLDLGCGDGLFTHLFAQAGLQAVGIDLEPAGIEQARARCAQQTYAHRPGFELVTPGPLPHASRSFDAVAMLDVIEHLPNPVAVLGEIQRVLKPGGHLILSTPAWQFGAWSDPVYHLAEYTLEELVQQVHAATRLKVVNTAAIGGVYRDIVVVARNP